MLVGGAIGDALGRPVECMSFEQACQNYPKGVTEYLPPKNNKWFKDTKTGVITDDTQLSLAIFKALIRGGGFSMPMIALYHIKALEETVEGWAPTTKEAVQRLATGIHWSESGKTKETNRGAGNGVVMKISPLGAWYATQKMKWFRFADKVVKFSGMTHYTQNSAIAGVVHATVISQLLWSDISYFSKEDVWNTVRQSLNGKPFKRSRKNRDHYVLGDLLEIKNYPTIQEKFNFLSENPEASIAELIRYYKNGNSEVVNSLPFSYALFLRNPFSVETIFNAAAMGGDADTNAKLVGEMIGALHGIEIFQEKRYNHLLTGLESYDQLIKVTNLFCDKFGVKD